MTRPKVTIIGAGQVGATLAQRVVEKELADVVLIDVVEGMPQGKALDLMEAAPLEGHNANVTGTNDYRQLERSDLVVVTAGIARKPGMSRMDLLKTNAEIVKGVAQEIKRHAPKAILIIVTNPLDVMTALASRITQFPKSRVMGMAGILDTARLRYFISERLGVSVKEIEAMVLGGHGDDMVPLVHSAKVNGKPITQLLPQKEIEALLQRTRQGGAEVVALLKQGSAFYAPASSVAEMIRAIVRDEKRILPVCAYLEGEYGLRDLFCGVPCRLGREGILEVVELSLTPEEQQALQRSAESVRRGIQELQELIPSLT